jgi:hypothetical protein
VSSGRYYNIVIGPETGAPPGNAAQAPSGNTGATFSSHVNGVPDRGALQVELDLHVYGVEQAAGYSTVKVCGVSFGQQWQGADFNGAPISISGGMLGGLPLAAGAAGQSGLLLQGTVFSAFGNWDGPNQTLDLLVSNDGGATQGAPVNLSICWLKGQTLATALQQTLTTAYPGYTVTVNINPALVLPATESGTYQTLQQLAKYVKGVSQNIVGGDYPGVDIILTGTTIAIFDGTVLAPTATQINLQDLMGQPTWLSAYTMSLTTVMRADLKVGGTILLPSLAQYQTTTGAGSQAQARSQLAFSGQWTIKYVRHVGNSRGVDAKSWVTTMQLYSSQAPPEATAPLGATS